MSRSKTASKKKRRSRKRLTSVESSLKKTLPTVLAAHLGILSIFTIGSTDRDPNDPQCSYVEDDRGRVPDIYVIDDQKYHCITVERSRKWSIERQQGAVAAKDLIDVTSQYNMCLEREEKVRIKVKLLEGQIEFLEPLAAAAYRPAPQQGVRFTERPAFVGAMTFFLTSAAYGYWSWTAERRND